MNRRERRRAWASVNQREYGYDWRSFSNSVVTMPRFPSFAEQVERARKANLNPEDGSPGYGYTDRDM